MRNRDMSDSSQICPCNSGLVYGHCCERYHSSESKAPTAVALMRSRYSAYVLGEIEYLVATTLPASRGPNLKADYQETQKSIEWIGLEVLQTSQGGEGDKIGKVEFRATYLQAGQKSIHHEYSRFRRHAGNWCYMDGKITDTRG